MVMPDSLMRKPVLVTHSNMSNTYPQMVWVIAGFQLAHFCYLKIASRVIVDQVTSLEAFGSDPCGHYPTQASLPPQPLPARWTRGSKWRAKREA